MQPIADSSNLHPISQQARDGKRRIKVHIKCTRLYLEDKLPMNQEPQTQTPTESADNIKEHNKAGRERAT